MSASHRIGRLLVLAGLWTAGTAFAGGRADDVSVGVHAQEGRGLVEVASALADSDDVVPSDPAVSGPPPAARGPTPAAMGVDALDRWIAEMPILGPNPCHFATANDDSPFAYRGPDPGDFSSDLAAADAMFRQLIVDTTIAEDWKFIDDEWRGLRDDRLRAASLALAHGEEDLAAALRRQGLIASDIRALEAMLADPRQQIAEARAKLSSRPDETARLAALDALYDSYVDADRHLAASCRTGPVPAWTSGQEVPQNIGTAEQWRWVGKWLGIGNVQMGRYAYDSWKESSGCIDLGLQQALGAWTEQWDDVDPTRDELLAVGWVEGWVAEFDQKKRDLDTAVREVAEMDEGARRAATELEQLQLLFSKVKPTEDGNDGIRPLPDAGQRAFVAAEIALRYQELIAQMLALPVPLANETWAGLFWKRGIALHLAGDHTAGHEMLVQAAVVAADGLPTDVVPARLARFMVDAEASAWRLGDARLDVVGVERTIVAVDGVPLPPDAYVERADGSGLIVATTWLLPGIHRIILWEQDQCYPTVLVPEIAAGMVDTLFWDTLPPTPEDIPLLVPASHMEIVAADRRLPPPLPEVSPPFVYRLGPALFLEHRAIVEGSSDKAPVSESWAPGIIGGLSWRGPHLEVGVDGGYVQFQEPVWARGGGTNGPVQRPGFVRVAASSLWRKPFSAHHTLLLGGGPYVEPYFGFGPELRTSVEWSHGHLAITASGRLSYNAWTPESEQASRSGLGLTLQIGRAP